VHENERQRLSTALVVRRTYGATLSDWASDDDSGRWRGDKRTPLERLVDDAGPGDFLGWRLLSVTRKTMRKEKSNLVQLFAWAKASGYLASVPAVELPIGKGTAHARMKRSGRGVHIPMTVLQAAQIVAAMPEWSSRSARNGGDRFLVRPFFEMMRLTGLREATLERLEVPRNWRNGQKSLTLADEDDKARYGRTLPILPEAVALLERYAPTRGHIFGHHDFRKHVKAAAAVVFAEQPDVAELFGGYHFRHFVATYLANRAGTNLVGAQFVLGHKDLGTTSGYVHADEDAARELLDAARGEIQKASRAAAAWARKRANAGDSVPILSPKPKRES
jgi:integrase